MNLSTLDKIDFKNKLVLLRIDINAPIFKGKILDAPRFKESSVTILELIKKKAKVVILAHQGRFNGSDFLPLEQHAEILSYYLGQKVNYISDLFGEKALKEIRNLQEGSAILLENVRVFKDEDNLEDKENRYPMFCKIFDVYVNDAFSVSHRNQGSIVIPPRYIRSLIGRSFEKELNATKHFSLNKQENTSFVIGGSKAGDYLPLFDSLRKSNNKLLVSGVIGNLFLISKGINLGYENIWCIEQGYESLIPNLKETYHKHRDQIILPVDFAIGNVKRREISLEKAPFNYKIWDVGKKTVNLFKKELQDAKAIFMKGPLGFSEIPQFSNSTIEILNFISRLSKKKKIFSLLGGGHLTTAIQKYKIPNNFSYISLSGGALIQHLSGKTLPGIEAINKSPLNIR